MSAAHAVQFYDCDAFLVDSVSRFVAAGLGGGDGVVVIATEPHRSALRDLLGEGGLDVDAVIADRRYIELDATATLGRILSAGRLDARRFRDVIGAAIDEAAGPAHRPVRAFGEMVSLLWVDEKKELAVQLEQLWNALGRTRPVELLCAYPIAAFARDEDASWLRDVCAQHGVVIPAESISAVSGERERSRAIAELQRRAARLHEAERKAREEAEAANRAKDEFLAMLGHELRNPLSSLHNAVLTARLDGDRRQLALDIAGRSVDQLVRLVDDLLDVARITFGRIPLRKSRVAIRSIALAALETTRELIAERGHTLEVSLPGSDVQVDADPTRLEQVIRNLVTNAAKYTASGGRIAVTAYHESGEAVIRVTDDGIGIAPELLPRIFDLFAQAERASDRSEGGLGIGLTVVKRLVELHGGTVAARSNGPERGAVFEVRLPGVVVEHAAAAPPRAELAPGTRARILVVEDNRDAAESLKLLLAVLGHQVEVVRDGARALEIVETEAFDLILMDIGLPGADGYEVVQRMRERPSLRDVRIVALTGYGRDEDRRRAIAAGFDQHLVKPVDPGVLKALLAKLSARVEATPS